MSIVSWYTAEEQKFFQLVGDPEAQHFSFLKHTALICMVPFLLIKILPAWLVGMFAYKALPDQKHSSSLTFDDYAAIEWTLPLVFHRLYCRHWVEIFP